MWQAACFVYVLLCGGVPYALAESGSLSVLSLNAAGAGTAPPESGAPWDKRAKRIATWAQTNHVVPDIIGLQELWGGFGLHRSEAVASGLMLGLVITIRLTG